MSQYLASYRLFRNRFLTFFIFFGVASGVACPPSSLANVVIIDNTQAPDNSSQNPVRGSSTEKKHENRYSFTVGLGMGYTNAKWQEFAGSGNTRLSNGGLSVDVNYAKALSPTFDAAFKAHQQTAAPMDNNQENVKAFHLALGGRQYFSTHGFIPFASAYLQYGTYRVWPLIQETANEISFQKINSGALIGFTGDLGVRTLLSETLAIDLIGGYIGYFDNPQYKVGGWNLTLQFVLLRN